MRIQFGECTFDAVQREVRRGPAKIHLSPKGFELLSVLVENRPRAMSKDELLERMWPGLFVAEASLAGLVAEIRRAISEDAREPRFSGRFTATATLSRTEARRVRTKTLFFGSSGARGSSRWAPERTSSVATPTPPFTSTTRRSRATTRAS